MAQIGFVVLSPEPNIARLKDTVRSIKTIFGNDAKIACSVAQQIKKAQIDEMKEVCPAFRGGETVTSLMNSGMSRMKGEGWRMFVMEGARMPKSIATRYSRWIRSENDVLFPITIVHDRDGKPLKIMATFEESTLNGMLIHSRLFKETGEFSNNPISVSKCFWAMDAVRFGASFKGIIGVKII